MKILIIGGVAAGTSAAAKARRNDEGAEIKIYDKDKYISYSGCGMPYYLGNEVESREKLVPRDAKFFKKKYNVDVFIEHEVLSIDTQNKFIKVKELKSQEVFDEFYDKLIIATGAKPIIPKINGIENKHVFVLRNINDMDYIKKFIEEKEPKKALIIGSGFIGLEVGENLKKIGFDVTVVEKSEQLTSTLDEDMSIYLEEYLLKNGINIEKGTYAQEITEEKVKLSSGKELKADIVIVATGVRPNVDIAIESGIKTGETGAIKVDTYMRTSEKDVFACGDCIEHINLIDNTPFYRPLGSTANKTGRIAGENIKECKLEFRGILGTSIFKIFDMTVANTGFSYSEAVKKGYDVEVCHNIKPNKPEYLGGKEMVIKAIADKKTGRLLGVQIVGYEGVDKRIDVFATAITFKAKVEDLFHLDLAYAPPFSTTKDPVMYTGMILENAISKKAPLITAKELVDKHISSEDIHIIDARVEKQYKNGCVLNAENIPHAEIRERLKQLDKEKTIVTYCNKGVTGNAVQNILINNGFKKVYNLSGGHKHFSKTNKDVTPQ